MKLTDAEIGKLECPAGKREVEYTDGECRNLRIRVTADGGRFYSVRYHVGGKPKRTSLGPASASSLVDGVEVKGITIAAGRNLAKDLVANARTGRDMVADEKRQFALEAKQAAEEAERRRADITLGAAIPLYLAERELDLSERWHKQVTRHLNRYWAGLHKKLLRDIDIDDVTDGTKEIAEAFGSTVADHARVSLSGLFAWAMKQRSKNRPPMAVMNPTIGVDRIADGKKRAKGKDGEWYLPGKARKRFLANAEIKAVWAATGAADDYSRICRLLLLTGQRRQEIGSLHWSEINFDKKWIELPGERTKNREDHLVPLSEAAMTILKSIPRRVGRDLVFGYGEGGFSGWSACKERLDARLGKKRPDLAGKERPSAWQGMAMTGPWRLHDLRRTVTTHLNEEGICPPHICEAITNHKGVHRTGVAGVYNRALYIAEKRAALDSWANHLLKLCEGNVVNILQMTG